MQALTLDFAPGLFRPEAIKKAAYQFSGDYWVSVESKMPDGITVTLRPRTDDTRDLVEAGAAFRTEVLDQELRLVVAEKTSSLSALILAHALSNIAIIDPELETADFREDLNGIAHEPAAGNRTPRHPRSR